MKAMSQEVKLMVVVGVTEGFEGSECADVDVGKEGVEEKGDDDKVRWR